MTSLTDLDAHAGGDGEKHPAFNFKKVGDGCKGKVLRSALVDVTTDFGKRTKLVVDLELTEPSKQGIVLKDADGDPAGYDSFPAGTTVTVWLPSGFGIGAVKDAVKAAGETVLADGGTLAVWLDEKRDTGKAKPANVYGAKYTAPATGTPLGEDPF